ncbi:hypothetical protein QD228_07025 [Cobetia sp. 3AK]|uniref:hypothetical protein n=1 Tax=Cobetia sp. 3AK TaxID=3040020 RepID=UPI00244894D2|nr:hypothetical protein [Cobetia sp. 3AK]MDH2373578.1 hypothetical protein [Cobetia sp. 3AK]
MINLKKGFRAEENLRDYFNRAGYFVVRGVPFKYANFDITDIDLWLYGRASSVSREITIVDIKNKKTPQAIERIFWIKGLQAAVGADQAIVATTEGRKEVKDFGKKLDVLVLDRNFISRLNKNSEENLTRYSDEEFFEEISNYTYSKLNGDWKGRINRAKSLLTTGLTFDNANKWLSDSQFFAEQGLVSHMHSEIALRSFYLMLSYFALSVDYLLRDILFLEPEERRKAIVEGFQYGSSGKEGIENKISMSLSLVERFYEGGASISKQIKHKVDHEFESLEANLLGDYFSKSEVFRTLFYVAKELEEMSMSREFVHFSNSSVGVKSLIGCLFDYWGMSRNSLVQRSFDV